MTIIDLSKDLEAGELTIVTEYEAPAERVWELWANPRMLEQWWGPPSHPATVTDHDFSPGGLVRYYMTGPDGERFHGGWRVLSVQPPHRLDLEDFFADADGNEDSSLPVSKTIVTISQPSPGVTEMIIASHYPSPEQLSQVLDMGMEDGIRAALVQTEALLAEQAG